MNISLTKQLTKLVRDKVKSGRYGSASEVVREALRLMERHEDASAAYAARLEQLRNDVQAGMAQLDTGLGVPADEVFERIRSKSAKGAA